MKLNSAVVFTTGIVQFIYFLNPKVRASSRLLCLYSWVCVRPVRKPHCWFSYEATQYLAQGQYMAGVGIEPRTSRSTVLCSRSITRPPQNICWLFVKYKSFVCFFFSHVGTKLSLPRYFTRNKAEVGVSY